MKTTLVLLTVLLVSCMPSTTFDRFCALEAEIERLRAENKELAYASAFWMQIAIETDSARSECEAKLWRP